MFPPRLVVTGPALVEEARATWQSRIDRLVDECGCGIGAAVALVAMGGYLALVLAGDSTLSFGGILLRASGVLFLGATVGKLAGIGRARFELRLVLMSLRDRLALNAGPAIVPGIRPAAADQPR